MYTVIGCPQVPASTGNQLDIVLNITADFTKAGVQAGVSVLSGVVCTIGSLPALSNPEGINLLQLSNGGHKGQSVIGELLSRHFLLPNVSHNFIRLDKFFNRYIYGICME